MKDKREVSIEIIIIMKMSKPFLSKQYKLDRYQGSDRTDHCSDQSFGSQLQVIRSSDFPYWQDLEVSPSVALHPNRDSNNTEKPRGTEFTYKANYMVPSAENSLLIASFPSTTTEATKAARFKRNEDLKMEIDGNEVVQGQEAHHEGDLVQESKDAGDMDISIDHGEHKQSNNEHGTGRPCSSTTDPSIRTYSEVTKYKFDLDNAWFHDEYNDCMSLSSSNSCLTCSSSSISDVLLMFNDDDYMHYLSNNDFYHQAMTRRISTSRFTNG